MGGIADTVDTVDIVVADIIVGKVGTAFIVGTVGIAGAVMGDIVDMGDIARTAGIVDIIVGMEGIAAADMEGIVGMGGIADTVVIVDMGGIACTEATVGIATAANNSSNSIMTGAASSTISLV